MRVVRSCAWLAALEGHAVGVETVPRQAKELASAPADALRSGCKSATTPYLEVEAIVCFVGVSLFAASCSGCP
jgi:hypothetical protein